MSDKEQQALLDRAINQLMEHFDAVQILVTYQKGDDTIRCFKGGGNWYARQGMAQEFIREDQARTDAREIADSLTPPDEGEAWKDAE